MSETSQSPAAAPSRSPCSSSCLSLEELKERAGALAGVCVRMAGASGSEVVELVPASVREACRALSARDELAGAAAGRLAVSLEAFDRIDPADPVSGTVRAGALASVAEVDSSLRGWGLTLGALTPRSRALTVAGWLEGAWAGLRAVPGPRLQTAAVALTVALKGGGLWSGPASPRDGLGPPLCHAFLGCGGQAGTLLEATLRALPRPDVAATVHVALERPEDVCALLRSALSAEVPLAEAQVQKKSRGYLVDLLVASAAFRARRDRAALEALVAARGGELRTMRRVYEHQMPFEGELAWERLPFAIAQGAPLGLYRLARESLVVAAEKPVKGALALDAPPPPLPQAFLAALWPLAAGAQASGRREASATATAAPMPTPAPTPAPTAPPASPAAPGSEEAT